MNQFKNFALPHTLLESLELMQFSEPTPIQLQAIPVALEGHDMVGLAQTGTGKTAAFAIPMITHLLNHRDATALVLVPTRELANQVFEVVKSLTRKNPEIKTACLIGGVSVQYQSRQIQSGVRIIVATPGRLIDHLKSKKGLLQKASIVVMDEADRMLDMGFAPQLKQIYPHLPQKRQTLLFSATFSKEIEDLSRKMLRDPVRIQTTTAMMPVAKIEQRTLFLKGESKNTLLLNEIQNREGSILVFVRTKRRTDQVTRYLKKLNLEVVALHGNKTQNQRDQAIKLFKSESARILCATDIVARGIDISHVAHVINYDLPQVAEDYIHRIGRTARNGKSGEAISFVSTDEADLWKAIEKLLKSKNSRPSVEGKVVTPQSVVRENLNLVKKPVFNQKIKFKERKFENRVIA